jgi:WbqC-like protein
MTEPLRHTVVAIHQPNFFPWLGYFAKLARADVFVVLDDVQFEKSGAGTWSNRVRLLVAGRPAWITMPIRRDYHGVRAVNEMQIDAGQPWRDKLLKTIKASYARAPHFGEVFPLVEVLVGNPTESLVEYNVSAVKSIRDALSLPERPFVRSSSLGVTTHATDRLIDLVRAVGGTTYLAGGGAAGYQEDDKFAAAGIELRFQNFEHPTYPQRQGAEFVPGLSCLDALLHCGLAGTAALLRLETTAANSPRGGR